MMLPLSVCPAAPAQGALAVECRPGDVETVALLRAIDHAPTRAAVAIERALLAQRGGGCHQRFGATQIELPGVGTLLYLRDGGDADAQPDAAASLPQWTPAAELEPPGQAVKAWDGSRAPRPGVEPIAAGIARSAERLSRAKALFVSHRRALPEADSMAVPSSVHVWVPGVDTWQALAERGVWVEGCAEGLGFGALEPILSEPLLQLPPRDQWTVLTHADAVEGWPAGDVIATYRHAPQVAGDLADAPPADTTHVYWFSGAQFERWHGQLRTGVHHACGPGKTHEHLRRAGVQNLRVFPQPAHWRHWLGV
jgi:hydroxymethylbilane synthase